MDEMAIAGGLRGAPVELAPCQTVDLPYIADAEIVLEAEILPTGWDLAGGRFGEFTRLMGGLHWNPLVRVKAISIARTRSTTICICRGRTLAGGADPLCRHPPGAQDAGCHRQGHQCHARRLCVLARRDLDQEKSGRGQECALGALSVMDLKHVVVVDDDIDVFDPMDVEWAIATRVQGDRDIMIVSNARAKPLDPSLPQGFGVVPTGAKVGIDATIPEGIPREHYERITYAYAIRAKIDDM